MNQKNPLMVFDWNKAATIIKERDAVHAAAGLSGDWGYTGGDILQDGKPVASNDTYTYLASTWATPKLKVDGELFDCYIMESDVPAEWSEDGRFASIYWPQSAVAILGAAYII